MRTYTERTFLFHQEKVLHVTKINRPLLNSKNPHFQNEAKCTTFLVEMSSTCMRMKIVSVSKVEHLTSFWYRGPAELGSGLLIHENGRARSGLIGSFRTLGYGRQRRRPQSAIKRLEGDRLIQHTITTLYAHYIVWNISLPPQSQGCY